MVNNKNILWLLMLYTIMYAQEADQWSWLYRKRINTHNSNTQTVLMYAKENVPSFTQLIFSWNAFRPSQGYFSFFVQARDAETKKWGSWHHMIDWGAQVQRSYCTDSDGHTHYMHVRLEHEKEHKSDGFRIKVKASEGALLANVQEIAVTVSDFSLFKAEQITPQLLQLPSIHISRVPQISQLAIGHEQGHRLCSPTSCTMLMRYLMGKVVDPADFADRVFDAGLNAYGSWPFNIAHAFEKSDGTMSLLVTRLASFVLLHAQLKRNIPVIVSVWGSLPGAPKVYGQGHLLVVVGWDSKTKEVLCHDPAFDTHDQTFARYPLESFLKAWELSRRLVYWVIPQKK